MDNWLKAVTVDIDISPVDTECDISGTIHSKISKALAFNDFQRQLIDR